MFSYIFIKIHTTLRRQQRNDSLTDVNVLYMPISLLLRNLKYLVTNIKILPNAIKPYKPRQ